MRPNRTMKPTRAVVRPNRTMKPTRAVVRLNCMMKPTRAIVHDLSAMMRDAKRLKQLIRMYTRGIGLMPVVTDTYRVTRYRSGGLSAWVPVYL